MEIEPTARPTSAKALLIWIGLLGAAVVSGADLPLQLAPAYPNLTFDDNATAAAIVPDQSSRVVVAFQRGQIRVLPEDRNAAAAPLFLDLREKMRTETGFEDGLHGLAFHPDFATRRKVYLCYTQQSPRRTVLSEFPMKDSGDFVADPAAERVLMEFPHPLANHWGGGIAFGPDGYLYVGIGDGGMRDDPYRLSQNLWTLHGKILRLDVNATSEGLAYRIPADNPFADKQEVRGEIWAYGIRNPWGMSFDKTTGTLWCADVGQDAWEEVNLITPGGNYGWSEREGPRRFAARSGDEPAGLIDPLHSYGHAEGISITGGFVYRGKRLHSLEGNYLFGDWGSGKVWALAWNPKTSTAGEVRQLYASTPESPRFNPTVIAADAQGEPLIFSHSPSVIFTLEHPHLLAEAEEMDEIPQDAIPAAEDPTDPPGDPFLDNETS